MKTLIAAIFGLTTLFVVGTVQSQAATADNPQLNSTSDVNIYPGGRTHNGMTPNALEGAALDNIYKNNVQIHRSDSEIALPRSAQIISSGEVVEIDPAAQKILVKEQDGNLSAYFVASREEFNELSRGDQVELFE